MFRNKVAVTITCNTIVRSLGASSRQFKKQSVFIEGCKTRLKLSGGVREGPMGRLPLLYGRRPVRHDTTTVPFYLPFILCAGTSYNVCDSRKRARRPNQPSSLKIHLTQDAFILCISFFLSSICPSIILHLLSHRTLIETKFYRIIL